MNERIEVNGSNTNLLVGSRVVDSASVGEILKLFWAFPTNALFHGEESYYIALLSDRLWVLPYFISGIASFLTEVVPVLAKREGLFRVEVARFPTAWRRRVLGLVPLFPTPALGAHPLRTLPSFQAVRPISANEI